MCIAPANSAVIGGYYVLNWTRSGQTLGMRAWHLRAVSDSGKPLKLAPALLRLLCGLLAWPPAALGVLWLYFDPDHLALHDRLSKTRVLALTVPDGFLEGSRMHAVHKPITAVGSQPTSTGFSSKSCPPFSMVRVMRKNTTPSSTPITVRVPAPVVRKGPNTNGQCEQGDDDDGKQARDARPIADLVGGGIQTVAAQMIDVRSEAAQRQQLRVRRRKPEEIRIDGRAHVDFVDQFTVDVILAEARGRDILHAPMRRDRRPRCARPADGPQTVRPSSSNSDTPPKA